VRVLSRQIAEDFARTGMGRSFLRPALANTLETYNGSYYYALSGTHYSMTRKNGEYYQRRWQIGPRGEETNVEEMRVD
jgi:hypothetical protein